MRRHGYRKITVERRVLVAHTCDGCGVHAKDAPDGDLTPVIIAVNADGATVGEGGHWTDLDYCTPCLMDRAPALQAAGCRAPMVTGKDLCCDCRGSGVDDDGTTCEACGGTGDYPDREGLT